MQALFRVLGLLASLSLVLPTAGCATFGFPYFGFMSARECMTRAMYFESNHSSEDGMVAVGTVVMNRVASPHFPDSVCAVVAQQGQFADGLMHRRMSGRALAMAADAADRVLRGERYAPVRGAMFFHTAGYTYPYHNMLYTCVAGGNAFYIKT